MGVGVTDSEEDVIDSDEVKIEEYELVNLKLVLAKLFR